MTRGSTGASRLVGIDLGTTNTAVAWVETTAGSRHPEPRLFEIPQLVAPGEFAARTTLPSFLYFPTDSERDGGALALPWDRRPGMVAGVFARDHGSLVPARLAASAKSWLSNPSVDRRARLLPFAADADARLSPVETSARLLAHVRDAWNHVHAGGGRLEDLPIVLTVPASFDEEARELTVEAAREVGLARLTLLEEPLAAVYAWIAAHPGGLREQLSPGELLLVCDVGGGTTDLTLIRAVAENGDWRFERTAVGDHLLLGGDNVDLALAALLERRLTADGPSARLGTTERQALRRQASAAKERLLAPGGPAHLTVTVLGSGRTVVGGARSAELTRDDVLEVLGEFLPLVPADDRPRRQVRHGLRELGLPYEADPAITRHLAAFLERAARVAGAGGEVVAGVRMLRPDAVLFNGGFFTPRIARERMLDALALWFGVRPAVLANDAPEAAVAIGAAFYAALRLPAGDGAPHRLLIRAGSARASYVGVETAAASGTTAVCVMPRGTQEGTRLELDREFTVIANQPAAFTLFSSVEREDPPGAIVAIAAGDEAFHRHAPLVTALRYGQRSRKVPIPVRLTVAFTEVGTLELWCESRITGHRWRLQFNLRGHDAGAQEAGAAGAAAAPAADAGGPAIREQDGEAGLGTAVVIPEQAVAEAEGLLRAAFGAPAADPGPDAVVGRLENALGHGKQAWPLPVIRRLADVLLQTAEGRRTSARHEARWLNLTGFCLRPGFGTALDPFRVAEIRKVYAAGLVHPRDTQCQVEWLVLWQRVAAGFTTPQQQELANRLIGMLGLGTKKAPRLNPQMLREAWRLLGSLERLDRSQRARLGDELMARLRREPRNAAFAWAIGRFGARVPLYGPLNAIVAPDVAERWLEALFALRAPGPHVAAAIVQIGARTDDPARDIGDAARERALAWLEAAGAPAEGLRALREHVPLDTLTGARLFGETLPEGLRLDEG